MLTEPTCCVVLDVLLCFYSFPSGNEIATASLLVVTEYGYCRAVSVSLHQMIYSLSATFDDVPGGFYFLFGFLSCY